MLKLQRGRKRVERGGWGRGGGALKRLWQEQKLLKDLVFLQDWFDLRAQAI